MSAAVASSGEEGEQQVQVSRAGTRTGCDCRISTGSLTSWRPEIKRFPFGRNSGKFWSGQPGKKKKKSLRKTPGASANCTGSLHF
ncbi:rCG58543 [Rattus norvegicus]|uniref:RCG58543 n=1 Tax=Rattus norvegicus TaxID=10116 RepID=A6K707_RAT|nr:rCG58543 [Rattus norvegicus]